MDEILLCNAEASCLASFMAKAALCSEHSSLKPSPPPPRSGMTKGNSDSRFVSFKLNSLPGG